MAQQRHNSAIAETPAYAFGNSTGLRSIFAPKTWTVMFARLIRTAMSMALGTLPGQIRSAYVESIKGGGKTMKVNEVMTRNVRLVSPDQTIQEAAKIMAELDAGIVPVESNDRLVGMLTDRDIAVRAVAQGKGPDAKVGDVMTSDVKYCFDDEDTDEVCLNLADEQIRRIPVVNRSKRLVGILSLGDLATATGNGAAGAALAGISRHGGKHS
jgi:CBS domain-containing protein